MSEGRSPIAVAVGTPVVVVRPGAETPQQCAGVVANQRPGMLAVRVDVDPHWTPGEPLLVIVASAFPRLAARAQFAAVQGSLLAVQLEGAWRPLDVRSSPRYRLQLEATVRSVLGTSRQAGSVIDISPGGASVTVKTRPGGRQVEIALGISGYAATLPGEVVAVTETDDLCILHVRFTGLSPAQQAFLRHVIGVARAAREDWDNRLAS